jgi:predicted metal-dependent HD superfamily phosphohydrolase
VTLEERWRTLGDVLGAPEQLWDSWGALLLGLYGAAGRHYHAQRHLDDVLWRLDGHRATFSNPVTAEIALWFHDAIYAVPSKRNEEASAEMCAAFLTSIDGDAYRRAPFMILATKHDGTAVADQDTALVLDIDLAGFADPWDHFSANNDRIRQEFAIYDDETYRAGRAGFLTKLLARGPLFRVLTELEAHARANIERHIAELLA